MTIEDNDLMISYDDAVEANTLPEKPKTSSRKNDPRFWKPQLKKEGKGYVGEYQSLIRLLPQGINGIKNRLPFAVKQAYHYIKEPTLNLFLSIKCRQTLNEVCPICQYNWAVYNAAKKNGNETLMKKATDRQSKTTYICNVYIHEDLNNPQFKGEVKLWDHTARIHSWLEEPLKKEKKQNEEEQKKTFIKKKKIEEFIPYDPIKGRNYIVIANVNPENGFVQYDDSLWEEDENGKPVYSKLADDNEKIVSILERCYSLNEFLEDVPSSENLVQLYQEFNQKVSDSGGNTDFSMNTSGVYVPSTPQNVSQGNTESFLGSEKKETVKQPISSEETNSLESVSSQEPIQNNESSPTDEEDELPF